jgi:hypothetical protein
MNPERVGNRPRAQHESRSPAQITALVMGVWWTTNGIGAFFLDPNLTTSHVSGGGDLFGVAITVNGWHALFHLTRVCSGSSQPGMRHRLWHSLSLLERSTSSSGCGGYSPVGHRSA